MFLTPFREALELFSEFSIVKLILSCIATEKSYIVRDLPIIHIIFTLVKAKLQQKFLILSSTLILFITIKLINNEKTLVGKVGNMIVYLHTKSRLYLQTSAAIVIGKTGGFISNILRRRSPGTFIF